MAAKNFKFALPSSFVSPTVTSVTSARAAWPIANALDYTVPRRPWRTTVKTAQQDLILNLGGSTTLQMIYIWFTNYPSVYIAGSPDNVSYTAIAPSGYAVTADGLTIPKDPDINRRRLLIDVTGLFTYSYLYIRLAANMTTDDSASYYSTGGIILSTSLQQMPDAMVAPMEMVFPNPETVTEFASGAKETNLLGVPRVMLTWGGPFRDSSAVSYVRAIDQIGSRPFVVWPNFREGGQSPSTAADPSKA